MHKLILAAALALAGTEAAASSPVRTLIAETKGGYVVLLNRKHDCSYGMLATFSKLDIVGKPYIAEKGCWLAPTTDEPFVRVIWSAGGMNDYPAAAFEE